MALRFGRRRVLAISAVVAFGALAAVEWIVHRSAARSLLTVRVTREDIEMSVLAGGTIEPLRLVSVGAQASGRILALHVVLGDEVRKGDLIAEIDPSTEKNALATAVAMLEQARAQRESRAVALREADKAFRRAQTTFAAEASSQADLETAEGAFYGAEQDVQALGAAIRSAQVNVGAARVNLGFTKVTAPIDGTVVAIVAPEGQTVNAVQAAPTIVKLADLSTMTVKAQISEADITRVHSGQKVYFTTLGAPNRRYEASLRAVEPAPESLAAETATGAGGSYAGAAPSSAVYYNGLFEVPNPDGALRPSMTAQVRILINSAKDVLTVPISVLGEPRPDGTYAVKVVDLDGRTTERTIRLGIESNTTAEVLSGLSDGERVVVGDTSVTKGRPTFPGFL